MQIVCAVVAGVTGSAKPRAGSSELDSEARQTQCPRISISPTFAQEQRFAERLASLPNWQCPLSGAADASLILTRVRGQAEASLFLTGRDVEERTLALRFDHSLCHWTCIDAAHDSSLTIERKQLLEALRELGPSDVKTLSQRVGKSENAVRMLIGRMLQTDSITKTARGVYALPDVISLETERHKPVETIIGAGFQR